MNRPQPKAEDRLIGEREAAVVTGFQVATLQRWRNAGKGPPYRKINRAVRYSMAALQKWIAGWPEGRAQAE